MNRCAVIGCGWAGGHHLNTVAHSAFATLSAAVDPDEEKRRKISERYGVPVYESLNELLSSGTPFETGIVATVPTLHEAQCERLISAGKNILCEKPVCRGSEGIARLQAAAGAAGIRFGVVFNQRYGTAVQKAKELIAADGSALHLVTASMYQHWPTKVGGLVNETFMITDACCHLLDLVTFLCGPVIQVKAVASKNQSELYSDVGAVLRFQNGCVGCISHSNVGGKLDTQHPFQCVDVHTGNARYRMENQCDRLTVYPHGEEARQIYETSVFRRRDYALSMQLACEDFLHALHEGGPLPADIGQALENMRVLEEILASMNQ